MRQYAAKDQWKTAQQNAMTGKHRNTCVIFFNLSDGTCIVPEAHMSPSQENRERQLLCFVTRDSMITKCVVMCLKPT